MCGSQPNAFDIAGVPIAPMAIAVSPHSTKIRTNTQRTPQRSTDSVLGISKIK